METKRAPPSLVSLMPSEILFVEDELDVSLGVGQTLFLQGFAQLSGAAEEHPHLGSVGKTHSSSDKRGGGWGSRAPPPAAGNRQKGSSPRVL